VISGYLKKFLIVTDYDPESLVEKAQKVMSQDNLTHSTSENMLREKNLINVEGRVHKKLKLNNNFHKRGLMGMTHFKVIQSNKHFTIVPPADIKRINQDCIEVYGDNLRSFVNEYLEDRKKRSLAWSSSQDQQNN
jgi:hypothetical protein